MIQSFGFAFVAVFVALDVIGTLPLFLGMTQGLNQKQRSSVVNKSMGVALLVAFFFVSLGESLFRYLGITFFDFKMAGGLILLLVSLADLIGGPETVNRSSGSTGIVPLAVPLITGPAVITTLMLQVNTFGYLIAVSALLANYLTAWVILSSSQKVTRLIGKDGTVVISKIAALLLTAIAVSMIRSGIFEAVAAFASNHPF